MFVDELFPFLKSQCVSQINNNAAMFKVFVALFRCAIDFKVRGSFFEKRKLTSRFFKCTALENTRLSRFKFVNSPSLISVRWRKAIDRLDTIPPSISRKKIVPFLTISLMCNFTCEKRIIEKRIVKKSLRIENTLYDMIIFIYVTLYYYTYFVTLILHRLCNNNYRRRDLFYHGR